MVSYITLCGRTITFSRAKVFPIVRFLNVDRVIVRNMELEEARLRKDTWRYIGDRVTKWLLVEQVRHRTIYIEYQDKKLLDLMGWLGIKEIDPLFTYAKPKLSRSFSGIKCLEGGFQDDKYRYSDIILLERYRIFRYVKRKS